MIHRSRMAWALSAALLCLAYAARADIKIKTRTTVMGHSTESTVYIKGARERREMSFAGRSGSTTITQCDQKRFVTMYGDRCTVVQMGGDETSCPAAPAITMGGAMPDAAPPPPRKGGTVTITRTVTDTGERQDMFGYKARHLKTTMSMEPSPDACNQAHTSMETDGWYADVSAAFSCSNESLRAMACGGMGGRGRAASGCSDRFVMKGAGGAPQGYPLKQTTTLTSAQGTFTTTTEVVELANATLDQSLFDAPPSCHAVDTSAILGGTTAAAQPSAEPSREQASAPAVAPKEAAPAPAPAVAPKEAGVVRIGVVALKDLSGQDLPTDNLRINLLSEIARNRMEAVPLDAETPYQEVLSEARSKRCDYILYTTLSKVIEPGNGGLPPASVPKGTVLDPAKFQALTGITLYKIIKPLPEIKDLNLAADAEQLGVNAVMTTFEKESDKVAQQVDEDAHPKSSSKAPTKQPAHSKPK